MRFKIENYIFPRGLYCVVCGNYIDNTRKYGLCDHCIRHMNFGCSTYNCSPYIDYGFSAMGYGIYERRLIFNLKYDNKTYMAPIIAEIIYDALYSQIAQGKEVPIFDADMIIPVPIHEKRLAKRGFNQADKIAKHLGKKLDIPIESHGLIRTKDTHSQRALSAEERQRNMEDVFEVPRNKVKCIKNKRVILLDDIYTTGATAISCAKALKESGVEKTYILTLLFAGNRHHLMVE